MALDVSRLALESSFVACCITDCTCAATSSTAMASVVVESLVVVDDSAVVEVAVVEAGAGGGIPPLAAMTFCTRFQNGNLGSEQMASH